MKKNLSFFVVAAFIISVIYVFAIINSSNDLSNNTVSKSNICTAQGDFMPAPYEQVIDEEISIEKRVLICSAQGDVRPPAWDEEENETTSGS